MDSTPSLFANIYILPNLIIFKQINCSKTIGTGSGGVHTRQFLSFLSELGCKFIEASLITSNQGIFEELREKTQIQLKQ